MPHSSFSLSASSGDSEGEEAPANTTVVVAFGGGFDTLDPGYTYEMDVEYVRIWQNPDESNRIELETNRGIDEAGNGHEQVCKKIRDGQIIIVVGGKEYTLVGQQIKG